MPVRQDLLAAIPGPNPAGDDLRYTGLYDKIRDARREDDEAPLGDWERERKKADYGLTIRLCTDALSSKSKDLQIAAWLTEAWLRQEGIRGLQQGLGLLHDLILTYWDKLYPPIEDGDAEFRATPLDWIGGRLEKAIKEVPLTKNGLGWFQYRESRAIGYEQDAEGSEAKQEARAAAIADGKLTAEEFDAALSATPKDFYVQLAADFEACQPTLEALNSLCEEKFGDACPSFCNLQESLETVQQSARIFLQRKREHEPDADMSAQQQPAEASPEEDQEPMAPAAPVSESSVTTTRRGGNVGPASAEEAKETITTLAQYLRNEEPCNPVPYLVLRVLQWGELWRAGDISFVELEPPPTELRRKLKGLAADCNWEGLLNAVETAAAAPFSRGWLDLHRYAVQACTELGGEYEAVASSLVAELKMLLAAYPQLAQMSMADDTPTANQETRQWLQGAILPQEPAAPEPSVAETPPVIPSFDSEEPDASKGVHDSYEVARQAAASGRTQEAIELLNREVAQQRSGRGRFHRRLQLAVICMSVGYESVAYPILQALSNEIEERRLGDWEEPDVIAQVLVLSFRCLEKLGVDPEQKQKLYAQICRLDPSQALSLST